MLNRLSHQEPAGNLAYGGLILSEASRQVTYGGQQLKVTNTEFEVLKVLLAAAGQAVSRDLLLNKVWGYEADVETRVTDDTIKRLRKKLREATDQLVIETVWGYGFKLVTAYA